MIFEWDADKDALNREKHGVSFEEAQEVFAPSVPALEVFDERHSVTEDRFITIGPIRRGLVLVVWTEQVEDVVRIISARWATKREAARYRLEFEDEQ
ncbi:MAG: BrnT family toxin [Planctomycetes bacterium]|nr:BrnT family toxin [Planctomycetota bacterium]